MADYNKFFEKRKHHTLTDSSMSEDEDFRESSPASESPEDSMKKNTFHCRICNQPTKGKTENKPEKEICTSCYSNFPNRRFCKSCRRIYPNGGETFSKKNPVRCNYCVDRLQRMRDARNVKKKRDAGSPERKIKKKEENETYVAVYVDGKCVIKKNFKV